MAVTLAEHDATSYAFYLPKFHDTHYDGHDHYVSTTVGTYYVKLLFVYTLYHVKYPDHNVSKRS